jgi:YD repeat-containing protein
MRIYIFCIILLVIIPQYIYSQENQSIQSYEPNVVPPNPSAFQFMTYGNIPVVNSTGTFTYSIPIYTIDYNDIKLPITLNYSSNGIKVDQISSITGTDWNLNCGGIISRVMNGQPDEKSTKWYTETIDMNDSNQRTNIVNLGFGRSFIDTEQDWFSFSVNGISGSFFFDHQMKIHLNCDEYVKIEFSTLQNSSTFTVIDSKGYKYVFGGTSDYYEETQTFKDNGNLIENITSCITSWYLKEIESPTKNKITFSYALKNNMYYLSNISTTLNCSEKEDLNERYQVNLNTSLQSIRSTTPTLTKITFGTSCINFDYYNDSTFEGNLYLKNITVQYASEDVQKFLLAYDLVECKGTLINLVDNYINYSKKRLFLNSISSMNTTNSSTEKYQFEYHKLEELPARLSYSKDKYGFPGFDNNSAFSKDLWEEEVYRYKGKIGDISSRFTANLEVNPNRVYTGMIKKITYPTGGYTTVDYEANCSKENMDVSKEQILTLSAKSGCGNNTSPRDKPRFGGIVIDEGFTYTPLTIKGTALYKAETNCPRGDDGIYTIEVKNNRTSEILFTKDITYAWWLTTSPDFDFIVPISSQNNKIGDMIIITLIPQNPTIPGLITADVSYFKKVKETVNLYGGGVRVKEITNYSDTNNKYEKRKFYYNKLDKYPSEQTSMELPEPSYGNHIRISNYLIPKSLGLTYVFLSRTLIHISSSPYISVYKNRNQCVNYTTITEITESNGAIERTFFNTDGSKLGPSWINGPAPLFEPPLTNYQTGLKDKIKTQKVFIKTSSGYTMQKNSEYEYALLNDFCLTSNIFSCPDMNIYQIYNDDKRTDFISIVQYRNYIQAYKLKKATDSIFESNGNIVKSFNYEYSNFPHFNLKKQEERVSDGSNIITNYKYAPDMNGQLSNMDKLIAANRVGEPVIIEKTKNADVVISAIKKEYLNENNLILPQAVYNKIGSSAYYKYLSFDRYDAKGNLLQYTTIDEIPAVYLYSYSGQYPIAEIKNATLTEVTAVLSSVFGVATADALSALATPNEAKLKDGSLQKALPNALVTTYTYKPLVGILTATDPSGITTYYDYDSFGRLKEIYMMENNVKKVVQSYNYHYQNQ